MTDRLFALACSLPAVFFGVSITAAAAPGAFIRVNQMGYEPHAIARAYLMTTGSVGAIPFHIVDQTGKTIWTGNSKPQSVAWGSFRVSILDFVISEDGTYMLRTDKPWAAASPAFRIGSAESIYKDGLANALFFYQNGRDGRNYIPTDLRTAPGHLNDANAAVYQTPDIDEDDNLVHDLTRTGARINAEGGWWDAGDYLKFVETQSYTVALMLNGIRDFPLQMGAGSPTADFKAEARFGLEWLLKMWDDNSRTLYYQVGIGTGNDSIVSDHDIWRLPQDDDTFGGSDPSFKYIRHRPVFVAGPAGSKVSPNLAGRLAAAFALGYQVFRRSDPELASRSLRAAQHVFALADTNPSGDLLTTAPFDFYPETEWRDDLEFGATELYFAVSEEMDKRVDPSCANGAETYLRAATHWAHEYITGPNDAQDSLNLYDVSGLAHFELYRAMSPSLILPSFEVSRADLLRDLKKNLDRALIQSQTDPFGFGFPWGVYDTATHGAGLSVMAKEYAFLTGSQPFENHSRRWAANILGANAWGASFIVGDGSIFPDCMQHQVANIVGSLDGSNPRLNGALVEGPNSAGDTGFLDGMRACPANNSDKYAPFDGNGSVFIDNVQSYPTVEPAVDLTAPSFLMFAWQIAGRPDWNMY